QWIEDDCLDHAEDRGIDADAEREGEDRRQRETRFCGQRPQSLTQILEQRAHLDPPGVVACLQLRTTAARTRSSSSWRRRCIVASSTTRPSNMKILRSANSA